jgi:hypothetical protein
MEPITSWARPTGMTKLGQIRGLATAGLLCAALAGCGTAMASATPATTPHAQEAGASLAAARAQVGCASANEATSATVDAVSPGTLRVTQGNAAKVRALFGDFCAALAHAGRPIPGLTCAFRFGNSFTGTFYDGQQILATFRYGLRGCPELSLTASGHTQVTALIGRPALAAPHLRADLAAVLGMPVSQV